jgi:4'-phosphopantetheinyl transferase
MAALHPVILPVPARHRQWAGRQTAHALSRLAREALHQSAGRVGAELGTLRKSTDGAPKPTNGWHWSLSHKRTYVGGVAGRHAVGFDIEQIRDVHPGLFQRTAADAEWALVEKISHRNLFRFWTAKEAVLKAAGAGLRELSHCRVVSVPDDGTLTLTLRDRPFTVIQTVFNAHIAAVTVAAEDNVVWHIGDPLTRP